MKKWTNTLSIAVVFLFATNIQAQWLTNGSNLYYNAGSIGIGTSTPGYKLHVDGEIYSYLNNTSTVPQFTIENNGTGDAAMRFVLTGGTSWSLGVDNSLGDFFRISPGSNGIDSSAPFAISTAGNVGIGTSDPRARFDIYNTQVYDTQEFFTGQDHILLSSTNPGNGNYFGGVSWTNGQRRRASIAAVMENTDADYVGLAFFTRGVDGPGPFYESMRIAHNGNVGIGTLTPGNKLEVNGKIRSKEVIVEATGWPDYVFAEDYELPTLGEIEAYINTHKHLPEIPSAQEVEENGLTLGEMNALLLKKIEELTLHTIEQEKALDARHEMLEKEKNRINLQQQQLQSQQELIDELIKRIEKLESQN